jgi:hypothetical protein
MNLEAITVTVGVKRCEDFQSVDCSVTAEFTLQPGENKKEAVDKAHAWLFTQVNTQASNAIREVLYTRSTEHN